MERTGNRVTSYLSGRRGRLLYLVGLLWLLWCSNSSRVLGRTTSSECGWKPTKIHCSQKMKTKKPPNPLNVKLASLRLWKPTL